MIEGEIEQWVDREKRMLRAGDSAFICANVVHASFNVNNRKARLLAILGPMWDRRAMNSSMSPGRNPWPLSGRTRGSQTSMRAVERGPWCRLADKNH